jgi:hypothetical protein
MKKIILFALLALGCAAGHAQNTLYIWQQTGEVVSYAFSEKPRITYADTNLILTTTKVQVEFPLSSVRKFTFNDVMIDDAIGTVRATLKDEGPLSIYTLGGVLVKTVPAEAGGRHTYSLDELPAGVYVVKSKTTSYKVVKR